MRQKMSAEKRSEINAMHRVVNATASELWADYCRSKLADKAKLFIDHCKKNWFYGLDSVHKYNAEMTEVKLAH